MLSREKNLKQLVEKQFFSAFNLSNRASLKNRCFPVFYYIFWFLMQNLHTFIKQLICSSNHPKELVKLLEKLSMQPNHQKVYKDLFSKAPLVTITKSKH